MLFVLIVAGSGWFGLGVDGVDAMWTSE